MSVNLQKGQKISLVKPGEPGLKRIMVGLGWDEVEQNRGCISAISCIPAAQSSIRAIT